MQDSVLNLGEKIVLASRLAAIEHVRQAIVEQELRQRRAGHVGDVSAGSTDGSESPTLTAFVRDQWKRHYRRSTQEAA